MKTISFSCGASPNSPRILGSAFRGRRYLDALTVTQIQALTTTELNGLTTTNLASLTATEVQAVTATQLAGLTTTAVNALGSGSSPSSTQIAGLTTTQLNAMTATALGALTMADVQQLTEESAAFDAFVRTIIYAWNANPRVHVYHYAPYEPSAMKRLMGRYAAHEADIDRMLRARPLR